MSNDHQPYSGPERRRGERRKRDSDRREEVRFEPEKDPRRSRKDRRTHSVWDGRNER